MIDSLVDSLAVLHEMLFFVATLPGFFELFLHIVDFAGNAVFGIGIVVGEMISMHIAAGTVSIPPTVTLDITADICAEDCDAAISAATSGARFSLFEFFFRGFHRVRSFEENQFFELFGGDVLT